MSWQRSLVCLAIFAPFSFCASLASTINVPADQPTIQDGINAAVNGDTVLVAPGTYTENINFNGKAITVKSSGGAAVTTIDGGNAGAVVSFVTGETNKSVLQGFTIQHGNTGVYADFASPIIENNRIINNTASFGGGLYILGASTAQVLRNTFTGNTGSSAGGAIALFAAGAVLIKDNRIYKNNGGSEGGAIWMVNEADEIIVQNLMYGDVASSGTEFYSLIPQSTTGYRLINNTIVSTNANADAAVVADGFNTNAELMNNIIIAPSTEVAVLCNPIYNDGPPIVQYNDAFSATGTSYSGSCTGFDGTNGNISANPLFVSKANYQLQIGSPAIGAGTTSAPDLPKTDFANKPRIVGGKIDMGAYENQNGTTMTIAP
jgi:serine protease